MTSGAPVPEDLLDLVVTAQLAGSVLTELARERVRERGHPHLRTSHGYVFQHLIAGPITVGELAERLGVTQQGASKAAAELAALGYVERITDAGDGRVRRVGLTERGHAAVLDARSARAEVVAEIAERLGPDGVGAARLEDARRTLLAVLDATGGMPAIRRRRVRQAT